jgi:hypothetical protein
MVAILTFVFSYTVTWVTAYFGDEPAPDPIKAVSHLQTDQIPKNRAPLR